MYKTPPFVLLLGTLVMGGGAVTASASGHGAAKLAPALKCGEHGEQAFALVDEPLVRAAATRAAEPIGSYRPAPDPRDTGLETFARCRSWDDGILITASGAAQT